MNINPFELLKNAGALQQQMGAMQERLGSLSAVGYSGGGMVEIEVNGKMEVLAVRIHPDIIDPSDAVMLEDLIASALNQAMANIREKITAELGAMAGGMGMTLPGMFGGN